MATLKKKKPSKKKTQKTTSKKTGTKKLTKAKKASAKKSTIKKTAAKKWVESKPKVRVGESIESIALQSTGGTSVDLSALKGKKVVLYFYPKDDTPGCTLEGQEFTRLKPEFNQSGAIVFGVSRDSLESHEKFKEKYCFEIDLLSDADEKLCRTFGVIKIKNNYGREYLGVERSTFVIDEAGTLRREWRGVRVDGHAEEVLDFVKSLS